MSALKMGLYGKKIGMTQVYREGNRVPVTAVQTGPCVVLSKREPDKHGYAAVQLGFSEKPARLATRPEAGEAKKAGTAVQRVVGEVRLTPEELKKYEVGKAISVSDVFKPGTCVDVVGQSKGKGYQGVMKLHHMPGFRNTHGTHEFFRHGGSIGCRLTPGRVHKGKRMSAHMGDNRCTVMSLEVVEVRPEENVLLIKGSIPGGKNGYVLVRNATKRELARRPKVQEAETKMKNPMKASKAKQG
jgi:large subunit ribosomal protein L3